MAAPSGRARVARALLVLVFVLGVAAAASADAETNAAAGPNQAQQVSWSPAPASSPMSYYSIDCRSACAARCSLSSRPNLCKRACGTCCARCHCVPPGTSGNHRMCPCYAAVTTRGGRPKCQVPLRRIRVGLGRIWTAAAAIRVGAAPGGGGLERRPRSAAAALWGKRHPAAAALWGKRHPAAAALRGVPRPAAAAFRGGPRPTVEARRRPAL